MARKAGEQYARENHQVMLVYSARIVRIATAEDLKNYRRFEEQ